MNSRPRKPSSIDVAKLAAVSQATVSYVLNGKSEGLVGHETRDRVLAAAREVGYRPNSLAKALIRGRSNTVGLFMCYLGSRYHADIALGSQEVLEEHGYSLLLTMSEIDHVARLSRIEFMMNQRVDALIVVGGFQGETPPDWLGSVLAEKIPCVVLDDVSCADYVDCVVSDDADGVRRTVAHLASLGHKRIAYHPGAWTSTTAFERRTAFQSAVREFGLDSQAKYCPEVPNSREEELANIPRLLSLSDRPTAIVAATDHIAGDVIREGRSLGIAIPGDIAISGYGNQEISSVMEITTVDQRPRQMGKAAALLLIDRLQNIDRAAELVRTPVELLTRSSTINVGRSRL